MWEAVLHIVGTTVSLGGNASSAIAHGTPHVCTCLEKSAGAMDSNPAATQDTPSDASADFSGERSSTLTTLKDQRDKVVCWCARLVATVRRPPGMHLDQWWRLLEQTRLQMDCAMPD